MKLILQTCAVLFVLSIHSAPLFGETVVVDWDQDWDFLHPTAGLLPAGSGESTLHPGDSTPWFAGEEEFDRSYRGPSFAKGGPDFEAGSGSGPLGYGNLDYTTGSNPEFVAFGTNLLPPDSGDRFTSYFRTVFTIPDDGNFYLQPQIRYLLDDGALVYLDGELILRVNVEGGDEYEVTARGAFETESEIRAAELSLPTGASTGSNAAVDPPLAGNAILLRTLGRLAPGAHTLAVSVHNSSPTSSDLAMAIQVTAEVTDCLITATAAPTTRDLAGTPDERGDDTIATEITVAAEGATSASWRITGPEGSNLVGRTGPYDSPVRLEGIPLSAFENGRLILEWADNVRPDCRASVEIFQQRLIGSNQLTNTPVVSTGFLAVPGWEFDEGFPAFTLNDPADPASFFTVTSEVIDLPGQTEVEFTGLLTMVDTSSGNEADDRFQAYLILDGDRVNPVSLIDRHDVIDRDGILSGAELAPGPGSFTRSLNHLIPGGVASAQVVIEARNNSGSESFTVSGLGFREAAPGLRVYARPPVYDNQDTVDPGDDLFTADLVITPANLGESPGWRSNETPASGSYADGKVVTFGPFRPYRTPVRIVLEDQRDPARTAEVTLDLEDPVLSVSDPENIIRVENGPGFDDDTLTFEVEITGERGGPGWKLGSPRASPASGDFGRVQFTVPAPLVAGTFSLEIIDVSYRNVVGTVNVAVPGRFLVGRSDLSGELEDLVTSADLPSSSLWQNDRAKRTLTFSSAGAPLSEVISGTIDLSGQDTVYFSAVLQAAETSTTSNFETGDRFRAELFYLLDGSVEVINLVAPYDVGDGSPSTSGTLAGANGPPNGFLNGYSGAAGTDLQTNVLYANDGEDYNANRIRDEFNRDGRGVGATFSTLIPLTAEIPAAAEEVFLVLGAMGAGGNESFVVSNVLFSTRPPSGDRDGDDLPDEYEIKNGLDPSDPSDRNSDLDGDGQSNYAEFLAGTAANDARSHLRITSYRHTGTTVRASWTSVPGKSYRIQFSRDLADWTDLGFSIEAAGAPAGETTSGDLDLTGIGTPVSAYFRVLVER